MFSAIGTIFGNLFGTAAAGERIIDGISNAADKVIYTEEEQAEDAAKARTEGLAVYTEWLKSTTGSRLARRFIALGVTGIWGIEHLTSVSLGVISVFATDAEKWTQASEMLAAYARDNNALVGVVLLFYFGGPPAMEAANGMVQKWVSK